ncbi:MAG: DUF433 domain-containing protein [Magnetococcus sp. YQC-5]
MDYNTHIVCDPQICGGAPVIRGTRVTLRTILASLADGCSPADIVAGFPSLTQEDIRAVIAFAASAAVNNMSQLDISKVA